MLARDAYYVRSFTSPLGEEPMKSLNEIRRIKQEVEMGLLKLPNVVGVDIGRKIVNGQKTDTLAIRVLVSVKKDMPEEFAVPEEIQGVPTDVILRPIELKTEDSSAEDK